MRSALTPALIALLLSGVACKDKPRADPSRAPPPAASSAKPVPKTPAGAKITWKEEQYGGPKIAIEGVGSKGELTCLGLDCRVGLDKLPVGTKVKLGDKEETVEHGSYNGTIDVGEIVGALPPKVALSSEKTVDPGAKLEITFPDAVKLETTIPKVTVKFSLENEVKSKLAAGTPVLFGKEQTSAVTPHSTMCLFGVASLGDDMIIGPAKTMREVDLVAISDNLPKRPANKKCGGYKATGETETRELELFLVDANVKLIERRTAKVVEEKKFEAPATCPMTALGGEATNYPDDATVKAWLRTKR